MHLRHLTFAALALLPARSLRADEAPPKPAAEPAAEPAQPPTIPAQPPTRDPDDVFRMRRSLGEYERTPALEINLIEPFLGVVDDKILLPVFRRNHRTFRGEVMLGTYADFAWGPISRPADQYGKVWILGLRPGYRQYLVYGFFVDVSFVGGWRHEEHNIHDGTTLNGAYGRLWAEAGWQYDINERLFVNLRGGVGLILFRTDRYGSTERRWQPAADVDFGVRF